MEIKVGLSKYTSILIDDWSTEDDDKNNIGHQLLKFVKESLYSRIAVTQRSWISVVAP